MNPCIKTCSLDIEAPKVFIWESDNCRKVLFTRLTSRFRTAERIVLDDIQAGRVHSAGKPRWEGKEFVTHDDNAVVTAHEPSDATAEEVGMPEWLKIFIVGTASGSNNNLLQWLRENCNRFSKQSSVKCFEHSLLSEEGFQSLRLFDTNLLHVSACSLSVGHLWRDTSLFGTFEQLKATQRKGLAVQWGRPTRTYATMTYNWQLSRPSVRKYNIQ